MRAVGKTFKFILIVITTLFISSCAYLEDRREDLTEMANVNFSVFAVGLGANTGPVIGGYYKIEGLMGGSGGRMMLGLGGLAKERAGGDYYGMGLPLSWAEKKDQNGSFYKKQYPAWGSVGFDIAFIFGAGVRVDVVEALDFVFGIFLIDFLGDDKTSEENESPEPES